MCVCGGGRGEWVCSQALAALERLRSLRWGHLVWPACEHRILGARPANHTRLYYEVTWLANARPTVASGSRRNRKYHTFASLKECLQAEAHSTHKPVGTRRKYGRQLLEASSPLVLGWLVAGWEGAKLKFLKTGSRYVGARQTRRRPSKARPWRPSIVSYLSRQARTRGQ